MNKLSIILISILFFSCKNANHSEQKRNHNGIKTSQSRGKATSFNKVYSSKLDTIEGIFSSASKSGIIYTRPFNWESGESMEGALYINKLQSKTSEKLLDSIDVYGCYSDALNNSSFIIAAGHTIFKYDVNTGKKDKFYDTGTRKPIQAMKLSPDKQTICLINWDLDKNKVDLCLISNKGHIKFQKTWGMEQVHGEDEGLNCSISWIGGNVIFHLDDFLYMLNNNDKKISVISSNLAFNNTYQISVDSSKIIFFEGNTDESILRYYDINRKRLDLAFFNLKRKLLKLNDTTSLTSSTINDKTVAFLEEDSMIYQLRDQTWQRVKSLQFFENPSLSISKYKSGPRQFMIVN
ncbi:MAG TPA: hypothetical protein VHB54_14895 [Mucilaginibacter sp.]|nr:hypothetical protein [Mucilaginibacter sp.]